MTREPLANADVAATHPLNPGVLDLPWAVTLTVAGHAHLAHRAERRSVADALLRVLMIAARTWLRPCLFIALAALLPALGWGADAPPIAAAADLKFALAEVAGRFTQERGRDLRLSFGSSGTFTAQIENGAPFELFLSADEGFVLRLADRGLTEGSGVLYAIGRIVVFAPQGSSLTADGELQGLKAALAQGRIQRFAIANPEHAPYGRAARSALRHAGLWEAIQPRLVLGENAAQAAQFAAAGSSQGGIIPLSRALEVARLGVFAAIPADWHADEPLRQRMVLLKGAGETARAFYAYLQGPAARDLLVRYGFVLPGETVH
jgi:molybdate transport system substrate-binding protein